jgi:hypothetical protein
MLLIVAIGNFILAAILFLLEPWADRRGWGKIVWIFRTGHVLAGVAYLVFWWLV